MNQNFMKLPRPDLFQLKKGFLWTFNPTRRQALELEIERALKRMGRHVIEISHPKGLYYYNYMHIMTDTKAYA